MLTNGVFVTTADLSYKVLDVTHWVLGLRPEVHHLKIEVPDLGSSGTGIRRDPAEFKPCPVLYLSVPLIGEKKQAPGTGLHPPPPIGLLLSDTQSHKSTGASFSLDFEIIMDSLGPYMLLLVFLGIRFNDHV